MATYLILNLVFLAAVMLILRVPLRRPSRAAWITCLVILVLTAVFDSVIIGLGIVGYDTDKILGIMIGLAPIEDFFYAVLAVILVTTLWHKLEKKDDRSA